MIEKHSAEEIGQYGYAHYSHQPVTPDVHEALYVPQSIVDGWEALCSCGEWRGFASFYEHDTKEALLGALKDAHARHAALSE